MGTGVVSAAVVGTPMVVGSAVVIATVGAAVVEGHREDPAGVVLTPLSVKNHNNIYQ